MSLLRRVFGPKDPPPPPRDVMALAAPLTRPAVHLVKASGDSASYIGGTPPPLPATGWPSKDGASLTFLACLDLPSVHAALTVPWLPSSGRLLFFYDAENQPWGFDPKDRGSFVAMHLPDGGAAAAAAAGQPVLTRCPVTPAKIETYPSWERDDVKALQLTDAESEMLMDAGDAVFGRAPRHQVAGYPSPIQGDEMELQCQLVSHGLYCGDASGYMSPAAARLRDGAKDWRLLLQIDSDDGIGANWGDGGTLYFWIREEDARAERFDRAWAVLQCY